MKRAAVICVLAAVAAGLAGYALRRPPPEGNHGPQGNHVDEVWLRRAARCAGDAAATDDLLAALRRDLPDRNLRISTLLAAAERSAGPRRGMFLDMLSNERPVEAAGALAAMMRVENDPDTAARVLDALLAATTAAPKGESGERMLARACELAQACVDEELARPGSPPERRREALLAVIGVFPLDEARKRLRAALEVAGNGGDARFLRELEWELLVGSACSDGVPELLAFVREHPEVIASAERKSIALEQIDASPVSAAGGDDLQVLLARLRPPPAADADFARWIEVLTLRGRIAADGLSDLVRRADPLELASLLHFGGPGWPGEIARHRETDVAAELIRAASSTADPERREFLLDAAKVMRVDPE